MSTKSYRNNKESTTLRFRGILADAAALGVTRCHLWYVLTGARQSPRLLKAYQELQEAKRRALSQVQVNYRRGVVR